MFKKSLLETNPYLKAPEKYRQALIINVASSTAVETEASVESIISKLTKSEKAEKITKTHRSSR
jgi:glucan phosphoethanolaminetransferase (alkaline phosphatase superfamily)